jgi:hypothetical protein
MILKLPRLWIILIALTGGLHGYAISLIDGSQADEAALFARDTLFEIELHLPLDSLLKDVGEDPDYHDGTLVYFDSSGTRMELIVGARARGGFRKNPDNCDFPPLKLKFRKRSQAGTIFEGLRDIKLVTHCQGETPDFEQYVLQEYLLYKIYNIYTPLSFKVRLARIHYIDMYEVGDTLTRFAFFLENPEDMASRNQGELLEFESAPQDKLDQDQLVLMAMFNYIIFNTDFSIPIMHNVVLVSKDYFEPPLPVPYDFDWSGLIDIPYDSPYADYKSGAPQRIYKGPCLRMKELEKILHEMQLKRSEIFELFIEFPYLDSEKKSRNIQDLYLFFIITGNKKLIREAFIKGCPGN